MTGSGTRSQAPAIVGGGGSRRRRGDRRRGRRGRRKKTHAVTTSPRALATAVRRKAASCPNKLNNRRQPGEPPNALSSHGATITSTTRPTARPTVTQNRKRGNMAFVLEPGERAYAPC